MRQSTKTLSIAAVLACLAGTAMAQTYSVSPGILIPTTGTVGNAETSVLTVTGGPTSVGVMRVTLDISHTWCSDLDIVLINPAGDRYIKLTSDNGAGGDNFTGTIFSDFAAASITTGVAPFTGEFRAEGGAFDAVDPWAGAEVLPGTGVSDLAGFGGSNANGDWRLAIYDDTNIDGGVLNSWSIEFVSSSQLGGVGSATGTGVCPAGGSTLITVRALPATGPASTGITGRVDLSSVGGGATQALFDNGTNGDVTAGDNVFSYRHTMPATQPTGTQSVTWTLSDAQARTATGSASFNVNCLAFQDNCEDAVVLNGPGTYDFDTTGMTVDGPAACTGNGSANAWLKYRATRTGEARIHTCGLATIDTVLAVYDACGGTVLGCDDDTCDPGLQSEIFLSVTEGTDYWIRISAFGAATVGAGQVGIEEQGGRLLATANVTPDPVGACEPMLVTATVTPGTDPNSTGITVTADLSDFGGGTAETMFDDGTNGDAAAGDNVWSINVDAPNTEGFWVATINATDAEGRTATSDYFFDTIAGPCVLSITAAQADPDPVVEGQPVLLTVTVAPATDPVSTAVTVTGDLTELGGSTAQQFFDDGTNGDVAANDNVFSFLATAGIPDAFVFVDVVASDAEGRTANDAIVLAVTGTPSGACCFGSSCQVIRQAQCVTQGGTFAGAGTNCGGNSYEVSSSSSAFVAINTTGTNLGIVGDDVGATITLPFAFSYSGADQTEVYANSNGLLSFGGVNSNAYINAPFPTAAVPNNLVGVLWDDMEIDTVTNPISGVYYQEFGTAPNRTFVISWEGVPQLAQTDNNNFQVVFTEGSANLTFRYGDITAGIDANAGAEDASGSIGANVDVASLGAGQTAVTLTAANIPSACDGNTGCGSIDFNGDSLFPTDEDVIDFFNVFAGGQCSTGSCGSIDFNGDGLFPSDDDILAFLRVFAGGQC